MVLTIAYINHVGCIGGAERSLLELADGVGGAGHRPVLLAPAGPLLDAARALGIGTVPIQFDRIGKADLIVRPFALWRRWAALGTAVTDAVRGRGAALIHANSLKSAIVAGPAARTLGIPLLWHARDRVPIPEPVRSTLIWAAQRNARLVLANSRYTRDAIGVRSDRCRVLPNGIPFERYQPIGGDAPARMARIGIVGRISPEKGHDVFVRMAARLLPRHPDLRFIVIGDVFQGEARYGRRVVRMVRDRGLQHAFEWIPYRDDPRAIYGAIDVLVVPSRSEGFGRVVVEAMAAGVPVVAAEVGGIPELAGQAGCISCFPAGGDREAAAAVSRLIDDPTRYRRASADGRSAARRFSLAIMIEQLLGIYRDLADD